MRFKIQPMKDELILDVAPICHFPEGLEIHLLNHQVQKLQA